MSDLPPNPVPAARPVFPVEDRARITALIDAALASGALTLGSLTAQFEEAVSRRVGTRHAVAVSSGTAALELVLRVAGVAGREVIVPANTFFATAAAVVHAGARPRFVDIDARTFGLSVDTIQPALGPDTAAVIAVHIGGLVTPDICAIRELCDARGIALIEDAAHAHGAGLRGVHAGSFGYAGAMSFYPTKVVTSGEGGMIVTDDERLRDEARIYRDQGKAGFLGGEHVRMGYAWRMSELHAAVGLVQWDRLDEFVANRRRIASVYDEAIEGIAGVAAVKPPDGCDPNYYKYIALLPSGVDRDVIKRELREGHGVSLSGEVYARPLHREPVFEGSASEPLPVAEDVCVRHVCLPIHSDMTVEEALRVTAALETVINRHFP